MKHRSPIAPPQRLHRRRVALAVYGVALLLVTAGCGPKPKEEADLLRNVGVVILSQVNGADTPTGQATFVELTEVRARNLMETALGADVGTCTVGSPDHSGTSSLAEAPGGARLSVADGVFTVDGQPYGQLRSTGSGAYELADTIAPLPPAGLMFTLPSSTTFGGVEALPVATSTALKFAPDFDATAVRTDTEFRWQPGSNGDAVLLMGTGATATFVCLVDDTPGTFAFPQETRNDLADAGFTTGQLTVVGRLATTSAAVGDSDLLLVGALQLTNLGAER